nr:PH and SEC7 domain-containing protein 4-like [Columba livia]
MGAPGTHPTVLPWQEEQQRCHEEWMERVAQELHEHQRNLPEKRGRALDEHRLRRDYLLYERRRYETYVQVLETWLSAGAQDLERWESRAGPALTPPENISERRTVRKIVPKRNKNLL